MALTFADELVAQIVTKLATATPAVTIVAGEDIFSHRMPEQSAKNPVSAVIDNGGPPPSPGVPINESAIQVLTRAFAGDSDFAINLAMERAAHIQNVLHLMNRIDIGNNTVLTSLALGQPADIRTDDRDRVIVSANYAFWSYVTPETTKARNDYGGDWSPNIAAA